MEIKVGELAARSGVSVRTLHYYEEIGLLRPEYRTSAGHRIYGRDEVARLQQVRSLVQLGLSLDEIKSFLGNPEFSLQATLELHIARLDEQIAAQRRLRQCLDGIARRLAAEDEVSLDELLSAIKETTMFEKHYTPEQMATLKERGEALGQETIDRAQEDWRQLVAEIGAEMEKGSAPASAPVQALARRWQALVDAFTNRDPEMTASVASVWRDERENLERDHGAFMPSAEMMAYIGQALRLAD